MITSTPVILYPTAPGVAPGTLIQAGPPGASAYQIALGEGFVGNETEWLASLVGPAPTLAQVIAAVGQSLASLSTSGLLTVTAGASIAAHRSLMFDPAGSGSVVLGDPTVPGYLWAGLAVAAAAAGVTVQAARGGLLTDPAWTWTPLAPLFAAPGGLLIQTAPSTGAYHKVGAALTATTILVAPEPVITRP